MSSIDNLDAMLEKKRQPANDQAMPLSPREQARAIIELQRGSALERELALQAAHFNIEGHCEQAIGAGHRWYDMETAAKEYEADVLKSAAYLEQRGMIEHHPQHFSWVRILEG